MRALATGTLSSKATSTSTSSQDGTRASSCQSALSSDSGGKYRPVEESTKRPSAGNVLIATPSGSRCTKSTTTRAPITSAPATPSFHRNSSVSNKRPSNPLSLLPATTRQPLQPRDKNAAPTRATDPLKRPPVAAMSGNSRPQPGARAQTPSLSAGAARALNKQHLTPKIAARGLRTPQHQTASVTTPLSKAPLQRTESASSNNRGEVASPLDGFLSNNITPRSGSRQSRASRVGFESAGSSPTGTPNPDSQDTWEAQSGWGMTAGPSRSKADDIRRPLVASSSPAEARMPGGMTRQDSDSKFFYASEATKSQTLQTAQQPRNFPLVTPQQQKTPTFFYANGTTVPESGPAVASNPPTPVIPTPSGQVDGLMSKFVYANATRDSQTPSRANPGASRPVSIVSMASKAPVQRPGSASASGPAYAQQRPVSPVKLASVSSAKNSSAPSLPSPRANLGPVPLLAPASTAPNRRSIPDTDAPSLSRSHGGHSRHGSVVTIPEQPSVPRLVSARSVSGASSEASSPSNLSGAGLPMPTAASGFASLLQAAEDFTSAAITGSPAADAAGSNDAEAVSGPQSPTKSSSQDQALTELVATARRERKVQDLEITNASLEAINRTLERQLRKQTAELRRFRRLSRSGRLSLNSMASNRVVSDGSIVGGALARAGLGLDDLSEEEDSEAERDAMGHEDEDDDEYDLSPSESGDAETSPGSRALRNARQRRRDEQRLQLDLSRHQQLLVDSQRMNQSLRRCLGWTEELIKEGRRALEYKVRVSEVELGGRVLAPEEIEERDEGNADDETGEEETLPTVTFDIAGAIDERQSNEKPDRDSGIDLPADGG